MQIRLHLMLRRDKKSETLRPEVSRLCARPWRAARTEGRSRKSFAHAIEARIALSSAEVILSG
jgi:hypothetical protein